MAMDKSRLSARILALWQADPNNGFTLTVPPKTPTQMLTAQCDAIAQALIEEIQGHAEVSVTGVTAGSDTATGGVS